MNTKEKKKRLEAVRGIVNQYSISTQDELIEKLKEQGFDATQATISRDIRDIGVTKVVASDHTYKYVVPPSDYSASSIKFRNILMETVIHVDCASNQIVMKTFSGMAQAAAAAVDSLRWSEVVGCIAGDDTLLIIMRSSDKAQEYAYNFKKILKLQ